jgi:hypothetical protein
MAGSKSFKGSDIVEDLSEIWNFLEFCKGLEIYFTRAVETNCMIPNDLQEIFVKMK